MKHIKGYEEYDLTTTYGCVTFVKYVLLEDGTTLDGIEGFYDLVHRLRRVNVKLAAALATVIMVGGFHEGDFMMPATRDCMAEFKKVSKMLENKKPLYLIEYGSYYEVEEVEGEEEYHHFDTTTRYKLTHHGMSVKEEVKEL